MAQSASKDSEGGQVFGQTALQASKALAVGMHWNRGTASNTGLACSHCLGHQAFLLKHSQSCW